MVASDGILMPFTLFSFINEATFERLLLMFKVAFMAPEPSVFISTCSTKSKQLLSAMQLSTAQNSNMYFFQNFTLEMGCCLCLIISTVQRLVNLSCININAIFCKIRLSVQRL